MKVIWTRPASLDVLRLQDHLRLVAPDVAVRIGRQLTRAPARLIDYPRIGERLDAYTSREVRRIIVGSYELRYEIAGGTIFVLRIWHCQENRGFGPSDD